MLATAMIARMTFGGTEQDTIGSWMMPTVLAAKKLEDERLLANTKHVPINHIPGTDTARNYTIELAKFHACDLLFMVDGDMDPNHEFFEMAVRHLMEHGPGVIASPYVGGPPDEKVQVFRWATRENDNPQPDMRIENYTREEAATKTGIEKVAAIGTGLIAFDLRVLKAIRPPYFRYEYEDQETFQSRRCSTEDVSFTRDLSLAGVPVWCAWDHWSDHFKPKRCTKPKVVALSQVPDRLRGEIHRPANVLVAHPPITDDPRPVRAAGISPPPEPWAMSGEADSNGHAETPPYVEPAAPIKRGGLLIGT